MLSANRAICAETLSAARKKSPPAQTLPGCHASARIEEAGPSPLPSGDQLAAAAFQRATRAAGEPLAVQSTFAQGAVN